jgi:multimeric flavodoxin WrbA
MKVLLINGSPHAHGCTYAALSVAACQSRNPSASQRTLYVKTMDDKQQIEGITGDFQCLYLNKNIKIHQ